MGRDCDYSCDGERNVKYEKKKNRSSDKNSRDIRAIIMCKRHGRAKDVGRCEREQWVDGEKEAFLLVWLRGHNNEPENERHQVREAAVFVRGWSMMMISTGEEKMGK
jgi:hypothetical protein